MVEPVQTGDELLAMLAALSNPHRLRVLAALAGSRNYVSQLARDVGLSRPLLHMHLKRLEEAGLIVGSLELSSDGKAMKFYQVVPFTITLTPERIVELARSIGVDTSPTPTSDQQERNQS